MSVEPMNEGLNRGLVEVAQVAGALSGFLTQHQKLRVDETESVDDDLALDGLDRVNDDGDCTGVQLLEGLLSVDINR